MKDNNILLLEEFDSDEEIDMNFNTLDEDNLNNSDNFEDEEEYENDDEEEEYENDDNNLDFTNFEDPDIMDNISNSNDNQIDIVSYNKIVPEIKIEIDKDENNEKSVKFSLNVVINENTGETIVIDLNITKNTYLMIAEELFT
jgi:hypothetical protein